MKDICAYLNKTLCGFCNGFFGRDSYGDKLIEAIGIDWIVVRNEKGEPEFAKFPSTITMLNYLEDWTKKANSDWL